MIVDPLERILPTVQKPARYTGGEFNEIKKDPDSVHVRVAFCFPDTYEIGMSNVGMRILYGVMNQMEGVWCERSVFFLPGVIWKKPCAPTIFRCGRWRAELLLRSLI